MNIKRILFPTDFSPCANQAFTHALFHAEAHDAELHIVHSVTWRDRDPTVRMPDPDTITEEMEQAQRVLVAEHLEPHKDKPFTIIEKTIRGSSTAEVILEYAKLHEIDFIVMGNHGRKGMRRFFLGSVAEAVARLAPCPVMTVHEDERGDLRPIRRILAPTDFSESAKHALRRAVEMAELHGSRITLLHVVQDFYYPGWPDTEIANYPEILENMRKRRLDALEEFADKFGGGLPIEKRVEIGGAYHKIIAVAVESETDLILMGSQGRNALTSIALGSVAERVIRQAPCPVYVIKAPPKK